MSDNEKARKQLLREVNELRQRVAELQGAEDERRRAAETLRHQNEYLVALHETALGLVGRLEITDLLQSIITRASALIGTTHGYIYLIEPGGTEMEARVGVGIFGDDVGSRVKFGEGLVGQIWQTAQPLIVNDYHTWASRVPDARYDAVHAAVGVPLKSGLQVVGAIGLAHLEADRTFGEAETQLLSQFAELASIALDNARLYAAVQQELAERSAAQSERERLLADVRKRALQLQTAAEVSRAASSILDLDELLSKVVELIRDHFALYYVGIFLVDETKRYAVLRAGTGEAGQKMLEASHKLEVGGASMVGWCVANARARIALDVGKDAVRFGNPLLPATRSELALPLVSRGNIIGAMTAQSMQEAAFSEEDVTTLQTMADQVANSMENARLFQETGQRITELSILNEISQAFSSALELDQLLELIYRQISRIFDTTNFFIVTYEEGSDEWTMAFQMEHGKWLPPDRRKLGIGLSSYIIRNRQPLMLRNLHENDAFFEQQGLKHLGEQAKSWMGVPLIAAGKIAGVMAIQNYEHENLYDEQDMALFSTIAANAATAVQNARLFQERERRITELSILNEISQAFSSALELDILFEAAHRQISRIFDTTNFFIARYEEGGTEWTSAFQTERGERQPHAQHKLGLGFTSYIIRNRQPLLLRNVQENEAFTEQQGIKRLGEPARSWMGVPLFAAGKIVGVMGIQNYEQENLYGEQDLSIFTTIGAQVAIALQNASLFEETRQRVAELSVLNDMGQSFSTALRLEELPEIIYKQVGRLFDTSSFYIAFYDDASDEWETVFDIIHRQRQAPTRMKGGAGLTGHVIRTRRPLLLHDYGEIVAFHKEKGIELVGEESQCWMGVPLIAGNKIVGVMAIESYDQESVYSEQDVRLFSTIALQAAIAIQNARLFEETQKRVEQTQLLLRVSEAAASTIDSAEVMRRVAREATRTLGADMAGAYMPDETGKRLKAVAGYHIPPEMLEQFSSYRPPLEGNLFTEEAYKNRRTVFSSDVPNDPRFDDEVRRLLGAQSVLLTPMFAKNTVVGGLWLIWWKQARRFTEDEKQLVEGLVRQAAVAIENARLFDEARARAEEMASLNVLSRSLTARFSVDEILEGVYQGAMRLFPDRSANFYAVLYNQEKNETTFALNVVAGKVDKPYRVSQAGHGITDYVLHQRETVLVRDHMAEWLAEKGIELSRRPDAPVELPTSWVGAPMIAGDRLLGMLALSDYGKPGAYNEHDRDLLTAIASQTAIALQNARLFEEARTRAEEMAVLNELGQSLTAHLRVEEVVEEVYRGASRILDTSYFYISLLNSEKNEVVFPLEVIGGTVTKPYLTLKADRGMTGHLIRTRAPLLIQEANLRRQGKLDIENIPFTESAQEHPSECWLGAPMIAGDQVLGTMTVLSYTNPNAFDEHDRDLLTAIASQTAIALQNARLFEEARTRAEEMAVLNELGQSLTAHLRVEEVVEEVYRGASRVLDTSNFYISFFNPEKNEVAFPIEVVDGTVSRSYSTMEADRGMTGYLIRTRKPLLRQEAGKAEESGGGVEPITFAPGQLSQCWAGAPLLIGDRVLGTVAVMSYTDPYAYNEHDLDLLTAIASQAAIALQNARLFEEQQQSRVLLGTRVKELDCLNDMGRKINETPDVSEFLHWAAEHIPQAMQYPDLCKVGIEFGGLVYGAAEALDLPCQMVAGLYVGNETVGQIYIAYTQRRDFLNEESALLGDIVRRVSGYIENRRLIEQTQARARREQTLREITTRVRGSTDPDTIMRTAVRELGMALGRATFVRLGSAEQLAHPQAQPVRTGAPAAPAGDDDGGSTTQQGGE